MSLRESGMTEGRWLRESGMTEGRWLRESGMTEGRSLRESGMTEGRWLRESGMTEEWWLRESGMTEGRCSCADTRCKFPVIPDSRSDIRDPVAGMVTRKVRVMFAATGNLWGFWFASDGRLCTFAANPGWLSSSGPVPPGGSLHKRRWYLLTGGRRF